MAAMRFHAHVLTCDTNAIPILSIYVIPSRCVFFVRCLALYFVVLLCIVFVCVVWFCLVSRHALVLLLCVSMLSLDVDLLCSSMLN